MNQKNIDILIEEIEYQKAGQNYAEAQKLVVE